MVPAVRFACCPTLEDGAAASCRFAQGLRVKGVTAHPGVFEMTWDNDGRASFSYGEQRVPGQAHVIWRRIGTHAIFTPPPGPETCFSQVLAVSDVAAL